MARRQDHSKVDELFACSSQDTLTTKGTSTSCSSPLSCSSAREPLIPDLPRRELVWQGNADSQCLIGSPADVRIMSYNLLADKFLPSRTKHLSPLTTCLDADSRVKSFLAEFKESSADVICLQEVSTMEIGKKLEEGLASLGYKIVPNTYY